MQECRGDENYLEGNNVTRDKVGRINFRPLTERLMGDCLAKRLAAQVLHVVLNFHADASNLDGVVFLFLWKTPEVASVWLKMWGKGGRKNLGGIEDG